MVAMSVESIIKLQWNVTLIYLLDMSLTSPNFADDSEVKVTEKWKWTCNRSSGSVGRKKQVVFCRGGVDSFKGLNQNTTASPQLNTITAL